MDLCAGLLVLGFVLFVITLLGHVCWLGLAAVGRALYGERRVELPLLADCPRCGWQFPQGVRRCPQCRLERDTLASRELSDLAATERQLRRFHGRGILDADDLAALLEVTDHRRKALLAGGEEPARAPQPSPRPAAAVSEPAAIPVVRAFEVTTPAARAGVVAETGAPLESVVPPVAALQTAPAIPLEPLDVLPAESALGTPLAAAPIGPRLPEQPEFRHPVVTGESRLTEAANGPVRGPDAAQTAVAAVAERQVPAPPPAPPRPPRRSFTEMLAGFMEERNILWGEVVGGLLIVGCSIALVISLWSQVEQIPYFPFVLFSTIAAALFSAGLYTLHHWKLEATSRGLLVIATLLVPLNYLVMAGLQRGPAGSGGSVLLELALCGGFSGVFLGLLAAAGRVLVPDGRWLFVLGILGTAASQLLVAPFGGPEHTLTLGLFALLAALPVACHVLAVGPVLRQAAGRESLDASGARSLLGFLGLATFALAVALGFLTYRHNDIAVALQRLAVLASLTGVPLLAGGLLVQRRLEGDRTLATLRTTGTGVSLLGMVLMLVAVLLSWPEPGALVLVCCLNFIVLTAAAFTWRIEHAHAAALPCLALGYLLAFHAGVGTLPDVAGPWPLLQTLMAARSGTALAGLVVVLGLAAEVLARLGQRRHGAFYAGGAGVSALASLLLVTIQGQHEPQRAIAIYVLYGLGGLALNCRWRRALVSYAGLALLLGATGWWLRWQLSDRLPLWAAALASEALLLSAVRLTVTRRGDETATPSADNWLLEPLSHFALLVWNLGLLALVWPGWSGAGSWAVEHPGWHGYVTAALALTGFALAWMYRSLPFSWIGSGLLLAGLMHLFAWDAATGLLERAPLIHALLAHATAGLLAGFALRRREPARVFLGEPLRQTALLSSVVALVLLLVPEATSMASYALAAAWLSALWLFVAGTERQRAMFAAFQSVMAMSVIYGVTAWLQGQPWLSDNYPAGLADPRSLQAYGIALGAYCLLWALLRLGLARWTRARELLLPPGATLDEDLLGCLVVGQLALALWGLAPALARELVPLSWQALAAAPVEVTADFFGPGAWWLLGVVTACLVATLWTRWAATALVGLLLLTLTVPILLAGPFSAVYAATPALRWGLGCCLLAGSALLWLRTPLQRGSRRLGMADLDGSSTVMRWLLVTLGALPILLLSGSYMLIRFSGAGLARPDEGTFFRALGSPSNHGVPLVLLALALVGHALRERSAGFAFAAGLVVDLAVMGGYALQVVAGQQPIGPAELARVVQLGGCAAALWALLWLGSRRWLETWKESARLDRGHILMSAQLGLVALANGVLLLLGLVSLTIAVPVPVLAALEPIYLPAPWAAQVGSGLGWTALVLAVLAGLYRERQCGRPLQFFTIGGSGMALVGLFACTMENWIGVGAGYRTLLLGWAGFALGWSAVAAGLATRHRPRLAEGTPAPTGSAVGAGVLLLGVLVVVLGLKAAAVHHDHLWAAGAIFLVGVAGAVVAVWQRQESAAFVAGLATNLAASLFLWHYFRTEPFGSWWYFLVQANGAASGLAALLWLAARQRFYGTRELRLTAAPLLAVQILLSMTGLALLLGLAFLVLLLLPDPGLRMLATFADIGDIGGWLALLLPMGAALWYAGQLARRGLLPLAVVFALGFGVQAACSACKYDTGDWLAFHVLTAAWSLTGLVLLGLGLVNSTLHHTDLESAGELPAWLRRLSLPIEQFQHGVEAVGVLVVLLVLRGAGSTTGGWFWAPAAAMSVVFMVVGLALWSRKARYVYESGLLLNLVGNLLVQVHGPVSLGGFIAVNVLCLALGAGFWSALGQVLRAEFDTFQLRERRLSFSHLALLLGLAGLTALVGLHMTGNAMLPVFWSWAALAMTAAALLLGLWDDNVRIGSSGFYLLGVHAVLLLAQQLGLLSPAGLGLVLACFVAGMALVGCCACRLADVLHLPERIRTADADWFPLAQTLLGGAVLALSVWTTLDYQGAVLEVRLLGALALALLVVARLLTSSSHDEAEHRHGTLALGALLVVELSLAVLGNEVPAPWMQRHALLLLALAGTSFAYSAGRRWLPAAWADTARRQAPILLGLAALMVPVLLGQEAANYKPATLRAELAPWLVAGVIVALLGMIATALRYALVPERDPLQLAEERRALHVYAAEVLLALLLAHIKLTIPMKVGPYWTFIFMGIAFAGVGLSELFRRRGPAVLAGPLERTGVFLPLIPLLALWLKPPASALLLLAQRYLPGGEPFLLPLTNMPMEFDRYAGLWLLAATLYLLLAWARQSFRFALVAALAGNFALWSYWQHTGLSFLVHPQFWLIPLALVLLVAEHLHRAQLQRSQSLGLRYLGLGLIYFSSTADLFIAGLGHLWLSLVLMLLSVAGVLLGIVLQIRAYLFLGVGFLFLVLFSMIWHAAYDLAHTWVWWASGIVLGVAILTLFAVFEKRRNDVLAMVEQIKQWR